MHSNSVSAAAVAVAVSVWMTADSPVRRIHPEQTTSRSDEEHDGREKDFTALFQVAGTLRSEGTSEVTSDVVFFKPAASSRDED